MSEQIITRITSTSDVVTVTLNNIPNKPAVLSGIFNEIAEKAICIDMITQSAPYKNSVSISFSASNSDLKKIFEVIPKLKAKIPNIVTEINTGNCKISLFGEKMQDTHGVAAKAIELISDLDISIRLISTSDVDISFVFEESFMDLAINCFKDYYGV